MQSEFDELGERAQADLAQKAQKRAQTKKEVAAGAAPAAEGTTATPSRVGSAAPVAGKVELPRPNGTAGPGPAAAVEDDVISIGDSVSSSDEEGSHLRGRGGVSALEMAKQESMAHRMNIAQKLQTTAVKDKFGKREEQLRAQIKRLQANQANAMDGLLTASMPATGRLHAAADALSLLLLVSSLSMLGVAVLVEARAGTSVDRLLGKIGGPRGWAHPPMLPLHCLAGAAALMLLLQLMIRLCHHAALKCSPVRRGQRATFARFMPITFVLALELYLGAYAWAFAGGGGWSGGSLEAGGVALAVPSLAAPRQLCAAAFLLLGTLRTAGAVLPRRKTKKALVKEDKQPLLPEDPAYNC